MTKNELKDLLFELLNENDSLFSDIALNDPLDALVIKSINGERFILSVDDLQEGEDSIRLWARNNPVSLDMELTILRMLEIGIITEETAKGYMTEITKQADALEEKYSGEYPGKSTK